MIATLLLLALQSAPPTAAIEGLVVRAGTIPPLPITNARLELTGAVSFVARTDGFGRFVFPGLPAGTFRLRVTKDGYLRQEYPDSPMDERGLPIALTAGQEVRDVVLRMEPAPTIAGVIRDDREAPLAGVEVHAVRRVYTRTGRRALSVAASTFTDDAGRYRLYWLDPGEYLISATPPPSPVLPAEANVPVPWAPTYYPGLPDPDGARTIRLELGRDAEGTDFKLIRQRLGAVGGNAVSLTTARPVEGFVSLSSPEDGVGVARHQAGFSPLGDYSLRGVAPGVYIISAVAGGEMSAMRIRVRDSLRVDLRLGPGMPLHGRVFHASTPAPNPANAVIGLSQLDSSLPEPEPVLVTQDGRFTFSAVQPGDYFLIVDGLPGDSYVRSATVNQADALSKPISINYGAPAMELAVELGADGGRVDGRVYDGNNQPYPSGRIILAPESESRSRLDRYRTATPGRDGEFTLRGIAPGTYRLFAFDRLEPNAHLNQEFLQPYENTGIAIDVPPSGALTVSLRLIQTAR